MQIERLKRYYFYLKSHIIVFIYNFFIRKYQKAKLKGKLVNNPFEYSVQSTNSENQRSVEILEEDFEKKEVLFSCYFIHGINPQTGETQNKANFSYIKDWYESLSRLNIDAIIIHDGIDQNFITKYSTEKIKFRRFYHGFHPLIDERWIAYYLFIFKTKIQKAFFTDIGDVTVNKSPFELINSSKPTFFIGRDNANKIRLSGWILKEISTFINESKLQIPVSFYYQSLYNVGIIGGNRDVLLFMLKEASKLILLSDIGTYKEMTVFNFLIHKHFFPSIEFNPNDSLIVNTEVDLISSHEFLVSGFPLNSPFKAFDKSSNAYFVHK
jgi:hypothetical protein